MHDALYAESTADGKLLLTVAIADPTAQIAEGSKLITPKSARLYQLSASFNIPNAAAASCRRPSACALTQRARCWPADIWRPMAPSKTISSFCRHHRIRLPAYDDVSDWLEGRGSWQPDSDSDRAAKRAAEGRASAVANGRDPCAGVQRHSPRRWHTSSALHLLRDRLRCPASRRGLPASQRRRHRPAGFDLMVAAKNSILSSMVPSAARVIRQASTGHFVSAQGAEVVRQSRGSNKCRSLADRSWCKGAALAACYPACCLRQPACAYRHGDRHSLPSAVDSAYNASSISSVLARQW